MRYFTIRNGLLFVGLQAAAFGCASLPDEAPQEFHSAKAALERADKQDLDDQLPATTERAETEFKEAVEIWKKSRDTDVKKEARADLLKTSKEKAVHAQTITEQALNLQDQIKAWDGKIETYTAFVQEKQDAMAQLKDLQAQNQAMAANQHEPVTTVSPDITLKGPVAYFGANQTDVDSRYQENIDNLARTLKADSSAKVTLSGFADPRGNKALNDKLARERAESVAAILKDKGVPDSQIKVEAWPAASKKMGKHHKSQAQLQLDRRVEAYISTNNTEAPRNQAN